MGKCLSRSKDDRDEEDEHTVEVRAGDGEEDGEKTFAEEEERRSADGAEKKEAGRRRRRKSSGVSRFSTKDQHVVERPFRVAAFNVRRFGPTKMKDPAVVDVLVSIIRQFEIILIQEVVDSGGRAVEELLEKINQAGEEEEEYQVFNFRNHRPSSTLDRQTMKTNDLEDYFLVMLIGSYIRKTWPRETERAICFLLQSRHP